ncbi:sterol desaturase family protein [Flavobacteriales bacterium]|nr:sterol desaturase family protein [Flavobacteriales bacterium]
MLLDYIKEIYYLLEETISLSLSYFVNTNKRIHVLYLLTSGLLAFYVYKKSSIKSSFIKYLFPKKIWLSKSAFVDYSLFCFNSLVKILLIGPYVIFGFYIAFYTDEFLTDTFGFPKESIGITQTLVFYTIALTVLNDLFSYLIHFCMHKLPFLWEFHKIHHSATSLNPLTQYRIHPLELIINNIRSILIFGLVTGLFDYLSAHQIDKLVFLGVNIFHFIFLLLGANLRHSHVKLKYPKFLEYILISPFQHQIHHSNNPKHFSKNMGSKFALWDWMLGTLVLSKSAGRISFGVDKDTSQFDSLLKNLLSPFKTFLYFLKRNLKYKKANN